VIRGALKSTFFYSVLVLLPFLVMEGLFRLLPVSDPPFIVAVSADNPVAHYQPNVDYRYSSGWNFAIRANKRSNNYGYANGIDYDPKAPAPLFAVIGDSFVEAQRDVIAECQDSMCFSHVGRQLDGGFANANNIRSAFDVEIKTREVHQAFGVLSVLGFDILRGLERRRVFAAHVKIHRDLCDHASEQVVGNGDVGFIDCLEELLSAAGAVACFQRLIAESCVRTDQKLGRPRTRFRIRMSVEPLFQRDGAFR